MESRDPLGRGCGWELLAVRAGIRRVGQLKIKLTIAYDGSAYQGWQAQRSGVGVQQVVEAALVRLFGGQPELVSSSRTDAGVHAMGMVAHFVMAKEDFRMTTDRLPLAINACLPCDIRVLSAVRKPLGFHARFDASGKQYRYRVWNHPAMNPLLRSQAWHVAKPLDLTAMRTAVKLLEGRHDFRAFTSNRGGELGDPVRTVTKCEIRKHGNELVFIIEGGGFLYKMCRAMVGTLVQVGEGRFPPEEVKVMLMGKDRRRVGVNAPAHGLVLWKVFYRRS